MAEKFDSSKESKYEGVSDAFLQHEILIAGVPDERRGNGHVEYLLENYILRDLCKDAKAKTAANKTTETPAK